MKIANQLQRSYGNAYVQRIINQGYQSDLEKRAIAELGVDGIDSCSHFRKPTMPRSSIVDVFNQSMSRTVNQRDEKTSTNPYCSRYYHYIRRKLKDIKRRIRQGLLTFENITESERKLFKKLPQNDQKRLRRLAIKNSKLFKAISQLHIAPTSSTSLRQQKLKQIAKYRLKETGAKSSQVYETNTVADYLLNDYSAFISDALYLDNRSSLQVYNNRTNSNMNWQLARYLSRPYIRKSYVVNKVNTLMCGIANIFALAVSRGKALPTRASAVKWFRKWTLGVNNKIALVMIYRGRLTFNPNPVFASFSRKLNVPINKRYFKRYVYTNLSTDPEKRRKRLHNAVNRAIALARPVGDSRVGLAQGVRGAHMFIVYKDLDGIWRTMDMYLDLEDRPEDRKRGDPNFGYYSRVVSSIRLVID